MGSIEIPDSPSTKSPDNWADLIQRAQEGCRDSFDILSRNCLTYLLMVAREELGRDLQPKVAASDLVQQTLLTAYAKFDQFKGQSDKELISWLKMILNHQAASAGRFYRQARKSDTEVSIDGWDVSNENDETPSQKIMTQERRQQMTEAMQLLPDHYREVLQLHLFEGLSFEAIGHRIGKSGDAVRKTWVAALRTLKKLIPKDDYSRKA